VLPSAMVSDFLARDVLVWALLVIEVCMISKSTIVQRLNTMFVHVKVRN